MTNRNAIAGKNIEVLFKNSIGDNVGTVREIKGAYGIEGNFNSAIQTGTHGNKCDVKIGFTCGRNIDANIKAYKGKGYNQATRWSIDNFASQFNLTNNQREELRRFVLAKTANTNAPLIPAGKRQEWRHIIEPIAKSIVKAAFSEHPSREIFVLYDRNESIMRIWRMTDFMNGIGKEVDYTARGNITIGKCVVLQRKGGNGRHIRIAKTDPKHPCNDIQIKLDVVKFINMNSNKLLASYEI